MDSNRTRSLGTRIRDFLAAYAELVERRMILDRPWTHDDLHWGHDELGEPELHGSELGRPGGPGPVTAGGWCVCGRRDRARAGR